MRVGWATDLHLNFVPPLQRQDFYGQLRSQSLDALLIGGDISEARSVCPLLAEIEDALPIPLYFVLGNHDFYGGSIKHVRTLAADQAKASAMLHYLNVSPVIELTRATALIGHDSWADGRLGNYERSDVELNDYALIEELRSRTKQERLLQLNMLGEEAADYLEMRTREAITSRDNVLLLTHVPPFREACWHEGQVSNADFLPHFACGIVGDRLRGVMLEHPAKSLTVLCGHTHSSGSAQILPNLLVLTGKAIYGAPTLQRVFDV